MHRSFLVSILLLFTFSTPAQIKDQPLKLSNPKTRGYAPTFFPSLVKEARDSIPSLGSFLVLVWQHHSLIYEGYFHGASRETCFNIKSATKSIVSAIAGVAKDKKLLPELNTPVLNILTEYAQPLSNFTPCMVCCR